MDYTKFLQSRDETLRLPYFGGHTVCDDKRIYRLRHAPDSPGWYAFATAGRFLEIRERIDPEPEAWTLESLHGHFARNLLITNDRQERLYGIEDGIARFAPVRADVWFDGKLWFRGEEFETEAEMVVRDAFEDEHGIVGIKGVTPSLAQAFLLESAQRELAREAVLRAAQAAERAEQERQLAEWQRTIEGRIASALAHTGARLVDWRDDGQHEAVVRYRLDARKFECVVNKNSLQIVDSGICLDGTDDELNLSSLPSAVQEAIETGQLHVYRHA